MKSFSTRVALCAILAVAGAACAADTGKVGGAPTLDLTGKADLPSELAIKGDITFAQDNDAILAATVGEFTIEGERHGYMIALPAGADVRLETTNRGSSRSLDTIIELWGPVSDAGFGFYHGHDDDDGWGRLSKLETSVADAGTYLAIVSTYDGFQYGHYRLEAECAGDGCIPDADANHDDYIQDLADDMGEYFDPSDAPGQLAASDYDDLPAAVFRAAQQRVAEFEAEPGSNDGAELSDEVPHAILRDGATVGYVVSIDHYIDHPLFDGGGEVLYINLEAQIVVAVAWTG